MDNNTLETLRAVYLTAEDLRVAASILYNAYHDDPYFIEVLGQDDNQQYEQKLRAAIREELNELWQQEQPLIGLFDGDRLIGVNAKRDLHFRTSSFAKMRGFAIYCLIPQ